MTFFHYCLSVLLVLFTYTVAITVRLHLNSSLPPLPLPFCKEPGASEKREENLIVELDQGQIVHSSLYLKVSSNTNVDIHYVAPYLQ